MQRGIKKNIRWDLVDARMLLCVFAAVLIAGIWTLTLLQLARAREAELADAQREVRSLARVFDEHASRTIEAADQAATYLRHRYNAVGRALDIATDLKQGLNPGELYNLFSIIGEHGDTLLSTRPFAPTNLSDREHIRVHMLADSGQLYVSKPVLGRVSKKWSIQMTRRINHPDGTFKGVVVVSMDPYYFTRLYDEVNVGRHGSIAMIGGDGVVRARRVGNVDSVGQDLGASALFAQMQGATAGSFTERSPVDGVVRVYAFEKLARYPLYVLVGLDRDEVLATYLTGRTQALLLASATTVLVLLFSAALILLVGRLVESRGRAIAANQAKSRFLANMSHELRTPLNGILGFSDMLTEELTHPPHVEFAQAVRTSGLHLLTLIEAVLELSALESGQVRLTLAPAALADLARDALAPHRPRAAAKQIGLDWEAAADLPLWIQCDRRKLLRLLDALVSNAVGFTQAGRVLLRIGREAGGLRFDVIDSGAGIAPELQSGIFDKFSQADDTPSRARAGAGLGLATAAHLAALMGGAISLDSQPGRGSVFSVRLPLAPAPD